MIQDFYPRPPGGGRHLGVSNTSLQKKISIHALRVEGDPANLAAAVVAGLFLSTPSGWRATQITSKDLFSAFISIHALRVEGDLHDQCKLPRRRYFYPRPPGGGRLNNVSQIKTPYTFLSTPSGWRATVQTLQQWRVKTYYFYPRPPGGGRPPGMLPTLAT